MQSERMHGVRTIATDDCGVCQSVCLPLSCVWGEDLGTSVLIPYGEGSKIQCVVCQVALASSLVWKHEINLILLSRYYLLGSQGPYWPTALMQLTVGPQMAANIGSRTPQQCFMWYFGCRFSVLNCNSLHKADDVFSTDAAILKIINCCHTICDWFLRVSGSWLSRGCQRHHQRADCFWCRWSL